MAQLIVHSVAKQNVMCLAKDKVLTGVNQSVDDLELLKDIFSERKMMKHNMRSAKPGL